MIKITSINKIEEKWLNLLKYRSEKLKARRRKDVADENSELSNFLSNETTQIEVPYSDASHQRRAKYRKERRF